ncbi:adenosine kinase [Sphingomonas sp.]|uniref:adenosine kinase n=1 Tax=Sphingomonas sp. TaxID=28214 RepID=UPI00286A7CE2|nr:adenosine kinase [Sphingomonas sp.]
MIKPAIDILAIGDAIVDVIATCDDAFIAAHGLPKGGMQLLDSGSAERLYAAMGNARETSGGSAANSMAGIAAMGGRAAFIGQITDDQLGDIFRHDMQALGVQFDTPSLTDPDAPPTGRCLILVTPDAQRTMNTSPGASHLLSPSALDEALIASAAILYLEGYLFGPELPRAAMMRAIDIAHGAGREIAFTLSESVCIPGRREAFTQMIDRGSIDLLFANEHEALQLTGASGLGEALAMLSGKVPTLVITRGSEGALALQDGEGVEVPAAPVRNVVDTTGAGDLFAAGFLVARARGHDLSRCLATGAISAAEIISHFGARPEADLRLLVNL